MVLHTGTYPATRHRSSFPRQQPLQLASLHQSTDLPTRRSLLLPLASPSHRRRCRLPTKKKKPSLRTVKCKASKWPSEGCTSSRNRTRLPTGYPDLLSPFPNTKKAGRTGGHGSALWRSGTVHTRIHAFTCTSSRYFFQGATLHSIALERRLSSHLSQPWKRLEGYS